MGGWSPFRCRKAAVSRARCTSSRSIPAGSSRTKSRASSIPTGGGSAAWTADGSGIFYTRYPHPGERPAADIDFYQQVWFHRLGTPVAEDQYAIGKDFPRIAEIGLEASEDGQWILASVANGDGGDFAHYLRDAAGRWQQLTRFEDGIKAVKFGRDGALYLLSRKDAPRGKVLRLPHSRAGVPPAHREHCP